MRPIDADALSAELKEDSDPSVAGLILKILALTVDAAPTVDAVPVVRCKDCLSGKLNTYLGGYNCRHQNGKLMNDNDFCSYGERRDDHGNAER